MKSHDAITAASELCSSWLRGPDQKLLPENRPQPWAPHIELDQPGCLGKRRFRGIRQRSRPAIDDPKSRTFQRFDERPVGNRHNVIPKVPIKIWDNADVG